MTEERLSKLYGLVLKKCADHPMYPSPTFGACSCFETEKKRINATHQELAKQPCETHTETVSSTCPRCVLWAVHGNDLKGEKDIDLSVTEPSNRDLCRFLTDQVTFERIRQGTYNFNTDWLAAMTQEEKVVANLTIVSDINKNQKEFSDVLSKQQTIDMIADRLG